MKEREKRLYRVTATYPGRDTFRRDYQSLKAAEERRDRLLEGTTYEAAYDHMNGFTEPDDVPPAFTVTITRSDPITWSEHG